MLTRIRCMIWKEALLFWRYKLLLVFVLLFPALNLLSVSEAVSADVTHIPTAVFDQDRSPASRELVGVLRGSRLFDPDYPVGSVAALEQLLQQGTARVGLVIPDDFGTDLASSRGTTVQVLLDGSETLTAHLASAYLEGTSYAYAQRKLGGAGDQPTSAGRVPPIQTRSRVWFNESMRKENFNLPAEMVTAIAMIATLLPAVSIVREREMGTLEQLFMTPARSSELILSKGMLAGAIAFVGFVEAVFVVTVLLAVPLRGSLPLLLALGLFFIFVEMGCGLVISAMTRTQGQALLAAFFWLILESILSGQILPVQNMPTRVRAVAQLAPSTHFTQVARCVMLRGSTLVDLWPQLAALCLLGVGLYTLATIRLRKRLD
jgi:ABC-2 type transport system permease protein